MGHLTCVSWCEALILKLVEEKKGKLMCNCAWCHYQQKLLRHVFLRAFACGSCVGGCCGWAVVPQKMTKMMRGGEGLRSLAVCSQENGSPKGQLSLLLV